jgi:uncharacterized protein involved in exopolysaccharide biosynthesis
MEKHPITRLNQEFDFGLFTFITRRSLLPIAGLLVLAVFIAFFYLRYTTPQYQSSVIIQLTDEKKDFDVLG